MKSPHQAEPLAALVPDVWGEDAGPGHRPPGTLQRVVEFPSKNEPRKRGHIGPAQATNPHMCSICSSKHVTNSFPKQRPESTPDRARAEKSTLHSPGPWAPVLLVTLLFLAMMQVAKHWIRGHPASLQRGQRQDNSQVTTEPTVALSGAP